MKNRIILAWPIAVHMVVKSRILRYFTDKIPFIEKILFRLPESFLRKIFVDDYTVTERIFERGFLFMNISDLPVGSRVFDVGCAESSISLELACLGYKVWGIDISDYPFYHPNLTFIKGSICRTNFEDNFFDMVVAISTIEHIGLGWYGDSTVDTDIEAMQEIRRILKRGGKLILTLPYGLKTTTKVFRVYDKDSLLNLIKGFEIVKSNYFININNDKYWMLSNEERVSKLGINARGRNEGNVCLVLKKI